LSFGQFGLGGWNLQKSTGKARYFFVGKGGAGRRGLRPLRLNSDLFPLLAAGDGLGK
jgi:hypothetical protein